MERSMGIPMGAATLSTGRSMGENGMSRAPLNTARRIPPSNYSRRNGPSNGLPSLTKAQVIELVYREMNKARDEDRKATEANGISSGVTVDLSHKQIEELPEEVVDIIKNDLERYYISFKTACGML
jgi:hypothetical protein